MSLEVLGHVTMSYEPLKGACCGVVMEVHLRYKPLGVPHIFRYERKSEFRLLKLTSFLMCLQRIKLHLNPGPVSSTEIFHLMLFMRSVSKFYSYSSHGCSGQR